MNILFICGCVESGKDGVGDYSRQLALGLAGLGIHSTVCAINDTYTKKIDKGTWADSLNSQVLYCRIPQQCSSRKKQTQLADLIRAENFDMVSLQFVPFAFHSKGLPFSLLKILSPLMQIKKRHIMFHELWVGMSESDTVLLKYWGRVQRLLIKKVIKKLHPAFLTTQSVVYVKALERIQGQPVYILPLVSNVEVDAQAKNNNEEAQETSIEHAFFNVAVFGTIHPGAPVEDFLANLKRIAQDYYHREVRVQFIGNNGAVLPQWISACDAMDISFHTWGRLDCVAVDALLKQCDLGVSTTPYLLSEKSGSAVAMLHAGVKVLSVSRHWIPEGIDASQIQLSLNGLYPYSNAHPSALLQQLQAQNTFNYSNNDIFIRFKQFIEAY